MDTSSEDGIHASSLPDNSMREPFLLGSRLDMDRRVPSALRGGGVRSKAQSKNREIFSKDVVTASKSRAAHAPGFGESG